MSTDENLVLFNSPEDTSKTRGIPTQHLKVVLSISFALTAEDFFGLLREYKATMLMDIRINRDYARARFSHENDLPYLCHHHGIAYEHGAVFAPTQTLREQFHQEEEHPDTKHTAWTRYLMGFEELMRVRKPSTNPMVQRTLINGTHEVVAFACGCAHHCDCHRSYVTGLLVRQLKDVELQIAYPDGKAPSFKSPRRHLLEALPHAGLNPTLRRGGRRG